MNMKDMTIFFTDRIFLNQISAEDIDTELSYSRVVLFRVNDDVAYVIIEQDSIKRLDGLNRLPLTISAELGLY